MATTPTVVEQLAPLTHLHPEKLNRHARAIRDAGMLPKSKPGGGVGAAHWQVSDYATFVAGLQASIPSEAVDAVQLLRSMLPEDSAATPFANFGVYLEHLIKEAMPTGSLIGDAQASYRLVVCLDPPLAYIEQPGADSKDFFFSPTWRDEGKDFPEMQRLTRISSTLIAALAKLAADQGNASSTPLPFPVISSTSASTGNEDGDALPEASPLDGNRSARANGSGTLHTPDTDLERDKVQGRRSIAFPAKSNRKGKPHD